MSAIAQQGLTRRSLALVAALVLLAVVGLALAPAPLAAISGSGCRAGNATTIYFSNAQHTTVVGSYSANCAGVCTGSGSITSYYEIAFTTVRCPIDGP